MKKILKITLVLFCLTISDSYSQNTPSVASIFPAAFVDNAGQFLFADSNIADTTAQVYYHSNGFHSFLNKTSVDFLFTAYQIQFDSANHNPKFPDSIAVPTAMKKIRMEFAGANSNSSVTKYNSIGFASNYYLPNTGTGIAGVNSYQNYIVHNVYANVDIEYIATAEGLKYRFIVHPGGDLSHIEMLWRGIDSINIDTSGNLLINHNFGQMIDHFPIATQSGSPVSCTYLLFNDSTYGFDVPSFNTGADLIIDPLLTLNLTLPGSNPNPIIVNGISTDIDYNLNDDAFYMTGSLDANHFFNLSTNNNYTVYPLTGGPNSSTGKRCSFAIKLSTQLNPFIFSNGASPWITFTSNTGRTESLAVTSKSSTDVYIGGWTNKDETTNFPLVTGASFYPTPSLNNMVCGGAVQQGFIQSFDKITGILKHGTYYGGQEEDQLFDIDYDLLHNNLIAVGTTGSIDCPSCAVNQFPISDGITFQTSIGNSAAACGVNTLDGFIVSLASDLVTRNWGTYYGGENSDQLFGVFVQSNGEIWVAGVTSSTTGICFTTSAFQPTFTSSGGSGNPADDYIGHFDAAGIYISATYFGSEGSDYPYTILVSGQNEILIGGAINGAASTIFNGQPFGFPSTGGMANSGGNCGFLASLHSDLTARYWSTTVAGTQISKVLETCNGSITAAGNLNSFYSCETSAPIMGGGILNIKSDLLLGCFLNWSAAAGCPNDIAFGVAWSPSGIYGTCGTSNQNLNCSGLTAIYLGSGMWQIITSVQPSYCRFVESSLVMVVNIIPSISSPYIYCGTPFDLTGSVTIGGAVSSCPYIYQWYLSGTSNPIAGATNQTYSVTGPGSYTLEVVTNCGSAFSSSILISQCCQSVVVQPQNTFTGTTIFTSALNFTDQNIHFVSGGANTTFTLIGNNIFNGCEVLLDANVKILLAHGATLTIRESPAGNFSYWHGCEHFWKGIYASDATSVVTISSGASSGVGRTIISDASNALVLENGTEFHIDQCDFVNNYIGMLLHLYNSTNYPNCSIYDVSFYGTGQMIQNSLNPNNGYIPQTAGTSLTLPACGIVLWRVFDPFGTLASPIINIGDYTYSNGIIDFNNLHYGILNYQASVNVQHCKFSNINSQTLPFSLQFLGATYDQSCGIVINGAGNIPLYNVIGDGNITGSNTFDHCITGIELIKYNGFSCDILSNTMTDIYQYGIRGVGCLRAFFNFNTNEISIVPVTGTMTPYESVSAITVYESDQIYTNCILNKIYGYNFPAILGECRGINLVNDFTGESTVTNNEAYNVSAGIHVVHSTSPLIDNNIIYFTDAPNCSTCVVTEPRGISVVNCPNGASIISGTLRPEITNNTVTANTMPSIFWGLAGRGIYVNQSPQYLVFNNTVNMQNVVGGICDLSANPCPNGNIVCNTFSNWDLAATRVSLDPGTLGPITTDPPTCSGGGGCEASGNNYLSSYQDAGHPRLNAFNTTAGNFIDWYFDNTAGTLSLYDPDVSNQNGAVVILPIGTTTSADCNPPIPMIAGGGNERTNYMGRTVNDSILIGINNSELRQIIQYHADDYTFNSLYSDSNLISTGQSDDAAVIAYYDSIYNSNLGNFRKYQQALKDTDYVAAQEWLDAISTSNIRESNEKLVSQIALNYFKTSLDTLSSADTLTSSEKNILLSIALQNSFIGGKGVHQARAMLNLIMDEPELPVNRFEDDTIENIENLFSIYPNPNDGFFSVSSLNQLSEVTIADILGRTISVISVDEIANKIGIDLSKLSAGIYLITVSDDIFNNKTFKIVIAK